MSDLSYSKQPTHELTSAVAGGLGVVSGAAKDTAEVRIDAPTFRLAVIGALIAAVELRVLSVVARVIELVVDVLAVAVSLVVVEVCIPDWLVVVVLVVVTVVVAVAAERFVQLVVVAVLVVVLVIVPVAVELLTLCQSWLCQYSWWKRKGGRRVSVSVRVRVVEETAVVDWTCVPGDAMQIWLYGVLPTFSEASGPLPELAALVPSQRLSSAFRVLLCCKSSAWIW